MAEYTGSLTNPQYSPTILPMPFAANGDRNTIPQTETGSNLASQSEGYPPVTALPINNGGIPPARPDMNGMAYDSQSWGYYMQSGGVAVYDANVANAIGGYRQGARLWVQGSSLGTVIVRAKQITLANPSNTIAAIIAGTDANWELDIGVKTPSRYIIETGTTSTGYWERYNDGWIVQGGSTTPKTHLQDIDTVTFEIPFTSVNYFASATFSYGHSVFHTYLEGTMGIYIRPYTKSVNSMDIVYDASNSSAPSSFAYWEAKGY